MVTYLGSLVHSCYREGGTLQRNITGVCGEASQCFGHTGSSPTHRVCAFPVFTAQAPGCSTGELSEAGPGLCGIPRSKSLRFSFLGTPERCRLGWACVLCPSQVGAAQASRCLASALSQVGCVLITSLVPDAGFPGCAARALSQMCRVSPQGS